MPSVPRSRPSRPTGRARWIPEPGGRPRRSPCGEDANATTVPSQPTRIKGATGKAIGKSLHTSLLEQRSLRRPSNWQLRQLLLVGGWRCGIAGNPPSPCAIPVRRRRTEMPGQSREILGRGTKQPFASLLQGRWRRSTSITAQTRATSYCASQPSQRGAGSPSRMAAPPTEREERLHHLAEQHEVHGRGAQAQRAADDRVRQLQGLGGRVEVADDRHLRSRCGTTRPSASWRRCSRPGRGNVREGAASLVLAPHSQGTPGIPPWARNVGDGRRDDDFLNRDLFSNSADSMTPRRRARRWTRRKVSGCQ